MDIMQELMKRRGGRAMPLMAAPPTVAPSPGHVQERTPAFAFPFGAAPAPAVPSRGEQRATQMPADADMMGAEMSALRDMTGSAATQGELDALRRNRSAPAKGGQPERLNKQAGPSWMDEDAPPPSAQEIEEMARAVGISVEQLKGEYGEGLGLNATQARNAGYLLRMMEAENTIRELADSNTFGQRVLEFLPNDLEALFMDPDYRRYMLARENFNEAALRSATGATINQSEMPTQRRNYFPSPNDDDETRALLQRQRQALMMALVAGSGRVAGIIPSFGEPVVPQAAQGGATHRFNPETGQVEAIQ